MRTVNVRSAILNIGRHRSEIIEYCQNNGVKYLALFGSQLRGDARIDSDIDLLVDFEPDVRVGMFKLSLMEIDFSEILDHAVQLRTRDEISSYFRQTVVEEAARIYANK